jgi:Leucine-rich repeat (LRR) protein
LELLMLPDNKISFLDFSFLSMYPKLKSLVVRRNTLKSLSRSGDQHLQTLVHLDLSVNQLHVLHPYILSGFPALKSLNLSDNDLHTISGKALILPSLQV